MQHLNISISSKCLTWINCRDVDEPRACHSEWSKPEREKQILYIRACVWNPEKRHCWNYLQGRNRGAGMANGHVGIGWGKGGQQDLRERRWRICRAHVGQTASGSFCVTRGAQLSSLPGAPWGPSGVGWGYGGREAQDRRHICIPTADSLCCIIETNATL